MLRCKGSEKCNAFNEGAEVALTTTSIYMAAGLTEVTPLEGRKSADCKWIKTSDKEPYIGGYYYCKIDTKNDAIVSTIVEWAEFSNGDHKYYDWYFEGIQHFNGFGEDAEVIEWLDEEYANQFRTPLTDEEMDKLFNDYGIMTEEGFALLRNDFLELIKSIRFRKMGSSGVDFDFVVWYSGMTIEQVKAAHTRYLNEQPPKTEV
jgi:hypothetical protein